MVLPMIVAMFFDDSVVRFTDFGTVLRRVPSDESLGYFHTVRFADLERPSLNPSSAETSS